MPRLSSIRRTCRATRSSRTSSQPNSSASVRLVMSSFVGPRPPVRIVTSLPSMARRSAATMASWSSPTDSFSATTMPAVLRWRAMDAELVSTICPMRISSPMVMIVAFMERISFLRPSFRAVRGRFRARSPGRCRCSRCRSVPAQPLRRAWPARRRVSSDRRRR